MRPLGAELRRSGRAKVVTPSPPKFVPSSENSAWFWLIGRICPWAGTPFPTEPAKSKISPRVHVAPLPTGGLAGELLPKRGSFVPPAG